ncbi:MAG TPA: hypothetical protein PLD23_13765 [Armatimonadota bacterium]|nr:hypothetical protein [Armatimonadota bacterium]HQK94573.1 hypothetical protein [Armatimonadota bacterium]
MKTLRWLLPCVLVLGLVGGIVGAKVLSINASKSATQAGAASAGPGAGHSCPEGYQGCAAGDPCPDCQAKDAKKSEVHQTSGTKPAIEPEECEKAHAEGSGCPLETKGEDAKSGGCPFEAAAKDTKDEGGHEEGGCPAH